MLLSIFAHLFLLSVTLLLTSTISHCHFLLWLISSFEFIDFFLVGADTGDWRPHLAMLLSAPEGHGDLARESLERMGESLLARRLLFAAHLCFLLASSYSDQGTAATPHLHSRIWLLGVAAPTSKSSEESSGRFVMTTEVERASTEAIQLTEVYEYALALATRDKRFFLPNFLVSFANCLLSI